MLPPGKHRSGVQIWCDTYCSHVANLVSEHVNVICPVLTVTEWSHGHNDRMVTPSHVVL